MQLTGDMLGIIKAFHELWEKRNTYHPIFQHIGQAGPSIPDKIRRNQEMLVTTSHIKMRTMYLHT